MKNWVYNVLCVGIAFMHSNLANAAGTTVYSNNRSQTQFVKIEILPDATKTDLDTIKYFWCTAKNACTPLGKTEGFTRAEINQRYSKLKESSFYKNLVAGGASAATVAVGGVLGFSALVGGAPIAAVVIVVVAVGGPIGIAKFNPKWDPFIAFKRKDVLSPEVLQSSEYLTEMNIDQFKTLLEEVLK